MKEALLPNKGKKTILIQLLSGKIFFFLKKPKKEKEKRGDGIARKKRITGTKMLGIEIQLGSAH